MKQIKPVLLMQCPSGEIGPHLPEIVIDLMGPLEVGQEVRQELVDHFEATGEVLNLERFPLLAEAAK